jgi:hypothetical protein
VGEDEVSWVFLTYINRGYLMNQLKRGWWKLHLRPGHGRSDGVTDDMIVYYGGLNVAVVVEPDDGGDLQPSALPPCALPPDHVEPAAAPAASADSGDGSDNDILHSLPNFAIQLSGVVC